MFNKGDSIENDIIDIEDNLINQIHVVEQVKSKYLKQILSDSLNKSFLIVQCIKSILLYTCDLQNSNTYAKFFEDAIGIMQKDLNMSDETILEILNHKIFEEDMKLVYDCLLRKTTYFIDINYELMDIGVSVLKKDYTAIKENCKIIINNIIDFIPVISTGKQIIEIIKDIATCVDNMDQYEVNCKKIKIVDVGLENIEAENDLLTKVFEFLYSYKFVQQYFEKNIVDIK